MKTILGLSILCSLTLFTPQLAEACSFQQSMSAADYAFAGVIFEGELIDVLPETTYNERLKEKRIISSKFLFKIDEVLRGELPGTTVLVGLSQRSFSPSASVEDFVQMFGRKVRVGLVTPEQHKRHCREVISKFTNGHGEKFEKLRTRCDFPYSYLKVASEIPFVHGAVCGNQFIFDTSKPIVVRGNRWPNNNTKSLTVFRAHPDSFTPELKEDSWEMGRLLEEGLALYNIDRRTAKLSDEKREEIIEIKKSSLLRDF